MHVSFDGVKANAVATEKRVVLGIDLHGFRADDVALAVIVQIAPMGAVVLDRRQPKMASHCYLEAANLTPLERSLESASSTCAGDSDSARAISFMPTSVFPSARTARRCAYTAFSTFFEAASAEGSSAGKMVYADVGGRVVAVPMATVIDGPVDVLVTPRLRNDFSLFILLSLLGERSEVRFIELLLGFQRFNKVGDYMRGNYELERRFYIEIHSTEWRDGNDLVLGGYSTTHGRDGREISRTENQANVRLVGYYDPECWGYSQSLWARFCRWITG